MKRLLSEVQLVAPTEGRVLLTGENGSGKEEVARLIHAQSPRKDAPFVEVNCAAIPEELIESELFGHQKGAFTGAVRDQKGKFREADGGTLFLDEVGDMSLKTQAKVLRALQEGRVEPIGGGGAVGVDVRVVAATNKNLADEIARGRFREALYFRLAVVPLRIPPCASGPRTSGPWPKVSSNASPARTAGGRWNFPSRCWSSWPPTPGLVTSGNSRTSWNGPPSSRPAESCASRRGPCPPAEPAMAPRGFPPGTSRSGSTWNACSGTAGGKYRVPTAPRPRRTCPLPRCSPAWRRWACARRTSARDTVGADLRSRT
ncbi:Nif-specific regulatory protein [mine drainage metagenome]|uniref:Nif-specific regulatory protein n=1 Tax=mine drainage metagenome TaxID=410659 RepID=A0A1J5PHC9_9ZZZZ